MTTLTLVVLGVAAASYFVRVVRGPGLSERVIAIDGLLVAGIAAVAVQAMETGRGAYLPVLVVITLVGFVGTSAAARFVERTERAEQTEATGPGEATEQGSEP